MLNILNIVLDFTSNNLLITLGFSKDLILRPSLFSLFINDIVGYFASSLINYVRKWQFNQWINDIFKIWN